MFHAQLKTRVDSVHYVWVTHEGHLYMDENCCCDMIGAINLFQSIDLNVKRISTYAANRPDTMYEKDKDGKWYAWDCRPRKTYHVSTPT